MREKYVASSLTSHNVYLNVSGNVTVTGTQQITASPSGIICVLIHARAEHENATFGRRRSEDSMATS